MKKITFLFIIPLLFAAFTGFSQRVVKPDHYCIYFTDKKGTPYSIDKPEEFLSKKAIERREKFNIAITEQDLPVNPDL
mgnify:FL=1